MNQGGLEIPHSTAVYAGAGGEQALSVESKDRCAREDMESEGLEVSDGLGNVPDQDEHQAAIVNTIFVEHTRGVSI